MRKPIGKTINTWKKNAFLRKVVAMNQRGTAMFVAVMMLSLVTGLGLLSFHVSSTELLIANYSEYELASSYLAESGVDQVLAWAAYPDRSPNPDFFRQLPTTPCSVNNSGSTPYDYRVDGSYFLNPHIPFSEIGDMGKIVDIRFYRSLHPESICTLEIKSVSTKGSVKRVRVDISKNEMRPITAGVQGLGNPGVSSPVWVHWGKIRYTGQAKLGTGDAGIVRIPEPIADPASNPPNAMPYVEGLGNQDHWLEIRVEEEIFEPSYPDVQTNLQEEVEVALDAIDLDDLKKTIMTYGNYYVVSCTGTLMQDGIEKGTFDDIFHPASEEYKLAWIDVEPGGCSPSPDPVITLGGGTYKGYFYFSGDITIHGGESDQSVEASSPPWPTSDAPRRGVTLTNINMDGLLYVQGKIDLQGPFSVYGAVFSERGFTGDDATRLEVWYNQSFESGAYSGLPPIVLLKGTWKMISNLGV